MQRFKTANEANTHNEGGFEIGGNAMYLFHRWTEQPLGVCCRQPSEKKCSLEKDCAYDTDRVASNQMDSKRIILDLKAENDTNYAGVPVGGLIRAAVSPGRLAMGSEVVPMSGLDARRKDQLAM